MTVQLRALLRSLPAALLVLVAAAARGQSGVIEGRLSRVDGTPLGGVLVEAPDGPSHATSDAAGGYRMRVPMGTHRVTFAAGDDRNEVPSVVVPPFEVTRVDLILDWELGGGDGIAVAAAAGRAQPLVRVPAELTVARTLDVDSEGLGSLPKLFEFSGPATSQSGLADWTLNTRGLAGVLNNRTAVRVDSRDQTLLFLGGQEWAALTVPAGDLVQAELIHGPSATVLYGASASGGALVLETRRPRDEGGSLRLLGGEEGTLGGDLRLPLRLGEHWSVELAGSYRDGDSWGAARTVAGEYAPLCSGRFATDCLPREAVGPVLEGETAANGNLRLDHHFSTGATLALEVGGSDLDGQVLLTELGRVQVLDGAWRRGRIASSSVHWDLALGLRNRDAEEQTTLHNGANTPLDEETFRFDGTTRWSFGPRLDLVAGLHHRDDEVRGIEDADVDHARSTLNPLTRIGSLFWQTIESEEDGLFGQLEWQAGERVTLTGGLRLDDSSSYQQQMSPLLAVVFQPAPRHGLRAAVSRGFQAPTLSQLNLEFDLEVALQTAVLEPQCRLLAVLCGFDLDPIVTAPSAPFDTTPDTRVLLVGNPDLEVEEVTALEVGYRLSFGERSRVDLTMFRGRHEKIIAGPLPLVGTGVGRAAPAYSAYQLPVAVIQPFRDAIYNQLLGLVGPANAPFLSGNLLDNTPIIALATYNNVGDADTTGADVIVDLGLGAGFSVAVAYSWLDVEADGVPGDLRERVLANVPENRGSVRVAYGNRRVSAAVQYRWADAFRFASGPFVGNVPSYDTVDVAADFDLGQHLGLGLQVANALDEDHFQVFGGDLLGRRAIANLRIEW